MTIEQKLDKIIELLSSHEGKDKYKYSIRTIDSSQAYPSPIKNAVNDIIRDYEEEGWELIDQQFASSKHTNGTLSDYVKETYTLKFRKEKKRN